MFNIVWTQLVWERDRFKRFNQSLLYRECSCLLHISLKDYKIQFRGRSTGLTFNIYIYILYSYIGNIVDIYIYIYLVCIIFIVYRLLSQLSFNKLWLNNTKK